ncbi:hypothetical protein ACQP1P_18095 [Dactylosporangium sp. CA-052675]|uniref:hypothetical protein n=1 Tax=Dactylosporangium sp. CA-052675 TaxID=3239927 RepID=UPI003D8A1F10
MPFVIAAVALVGLLCLVDLLLTVAVIRRLREHTTALAELKAKSPDAGLLRPGTPLPRFAGSRPDLEVLAFLSTTCSVCVTELPDLAAFLAGRAAPERALVVVAGPDNADAHRLTDGLEAFATVLREPLDGPVATAFDNHLFPTFYLVSDGVVRASAISVESLTEPATL